MPTTGFTMACFILISGLLDELIQRVSAKRCPHYFVSQQNLFENIPDDFLATIGQKLVEIRRNPTRQLGRIVPPMTKEETLELQEKMAETSLEYKSALDMLLKLKFRTSESEY